MTKRIEKMNIELAGNYADELKTLVSSLCEDIKDSESVTDAWNKIDRFYKEISKKIEIKTMYFEMNEFDINTDVWYIDGIAYKEDGEFTLKTVRFDEKENCIWLVPANEEYSPIKITEENDFLIWGVLTYNIKRQLRKGR
jgi:hypothetical protein